MADFYTEVIQEARRLTGEDSGPRMLATAQMLLDGVSMLFPANDDFNQAVKRVTAERALGRLTGGDAVAAGRLQ